MSLATPDNISSFQRKLYTKSKQEPEFRFYSLIDKVYRKDVLCHAYRMVHGKEKAPGVDGVTFEQIEEEGRKEELLEEIHQQLKEETYKADPVRRTEIEKPGGGKRPLGIPTVKDRIVQAAVKIVIEPIFEADMKENAYGFRPDRKAWQAIARVHRQLTKEGKQQVMDADLKEYFDRIPHDQLTKSVARRISDGRILALINQWLKAPVHRESEETGDDQESGPKDNNRGTPQGGVISPLLSNIYINRMLKAWEDQGASDQLEADLVDFADDFVILTRNKAKKAREWTEKVTEAIGLTLNKEKTSLCDVEAGDQFDFLGYTYGKRIFPKNGQEYIAAKPSRESIDRRKEKIRTFLKPGHARSWEEHLKLFRKKLVGWLNYYQYGTLGEMANELGHYIRERLRKYLDRLGISFGVRVRKVVHWLMENMLGPWVILKDLKEQDTVWDLL